MKRNRKIGVAGLAIAMAALAAPVGAAHLYWSKFPVKTDTEAKCLQLAYGVVSQNGLQGVKRSKLEVAGSKNGVYVSVTCVGRGGGQNAMAVVMAMSDDGRAALGARDQIAGKLAKTQFID